MKDLVSNIDDEMFDQTISAGTTLVDFWAPWCLPCLMQGSILEKLAEKLGNRIKFVKINVDSNKEISANYEVSSIPTMLLFKNGKIEKRFIGMQTEEYLKDEINNINLRRKK
jgi:thioredoxin 1